MTYELFSSLIDRAKFDFDLLQDLKENYNDKYNLIELHLTGFQHIRLNGETFDISTKKNLYKFFETI